MSFMPQPQPDACRAWMPAPIPAPPGPPAAPLVCHMPEGHDGQHSDVRHPRPLDRRWDGDARPPRADTGTTVAAAPDDGLRDQLLAAICRCVGEDPAEADPSEVDDLMRHVLPVVRAYAAEQIEARLRAVVELRDDLAAGHTVGLIRADVVDRLSAALGGRR